jgi:hypothetical protein
MLFTRELLNDCMCVDILIKSVCACQYFMIVLFLLDVYVVLFVLIKRCWLTVIFGSILFILTYRLLLAVGCCLLYFLFALKHCNSMR